VIRNLVFNADDLSLSAKGSRDSAFSGIIAFTAPVRITISDSYLAHSASWIPLSICRYCADQRKGILLHSASLPLLIPATVEHLHCPGSITNANVAQNLKKWHTPPRTVSLAELSSLRTFRSPADGMKRCSSGFSFLPRLRFRT
jgi:hypothetical protein